MRELSFEENKRYQLGILKNVTKFCDENGLRYYLAYGTLIGAVRHQGFIPWDDDIDLQMPRADYEKFIAIYKDEIYKVIDPCAEMARHSIVKVVDTRTVKIEKAVKYEAGEQLGIDIDIFPLDGQPDNEKLYKKIYKTKHRLLRKFHYRIADIKQYSLKAKIAYFIPYVLAQFTSKNYILKKIRKINMQFGYDASCYIGSTDSLYNSIKNRNPREWYSETIELNFEGEKFKAPIGYDKILKQMYGDYMTLPPKEKQVTHHSNKVYLM